MLKTDDSIIQSTSGINYENIFQTAISNERELAESRLFRLWRDPGFWYENSEASVRFTEAQLAEIRKITLAKVICENCDVVDKIQKSVFDQYHEFLNERVPCRSLPAVNLNLWKDEVGYHSDNLVTFS